MSPDQKTAGSILFGKEDEWPFPKSSKKHKSTMAVTSTKTSTTKTVTTKKKKTTATESSVSTAATTATTKTTQKSDSLNKQPCKKRGKSGTLSYGKRLNNQEVELVVTGTNVCAVGSLRTVDDNLITSQKV